MTKREIILIVAIVLAVIGVVAVAFWRPPSAVPVAEAPKLMPPPTHPAATTPWPVITSLMDYQQISLKTMSVQAATKLYIDKIKQDHDYDWKVALNFYGKVVDENNQPVPGATAHLQWNTLGVPGGTSERQTQSDGNGLFSLTGQHGKVLEVRVEKNGYYTVEGGNGALAFEFANPSSPNYYESESNNPVIFHLRKKGEGEKLFSKTLIVPLNNNHPQARVNLMQGFIKPDGTLVIQTDKSRWLPGNQPFPWTVNLSMTEGGLVETDDQFPFLAPTGGYSSTINLDMTNTDHSVWQGGVNKTYYFYLPSTNTYGRMTVNTLSSLPFVSLNYVYNLTPGSRILEPAP